ncbi:gpmA, partial [Symbiodinium sp. CCMP2456]
VVLLRHGESEWSAEKNFAGWMDVDLTESGKKAAADAGKCLKEKGLKPGVVFTSKLRRSVCTAWLALMESDNVTLPIINSWRLNERHYGELGWVIRKYGGQFSYMIVRLFQLRCLGMAGQGGSLAAALQELQEARQQLRNVLFRATAEDSRPAGGSGGGRSGSGGKTRLRFLGHASHRRCGLFLLRVSFRAWAGEAKSKSGYCPVLAELHFRLRNRAGLLRALSAWRLSLRRDARLRRQERLAQTHAAEVARAAGAQHVSEGRLELLCSRLASSTAAACLSRRAFLVWRYHYHEAQLEAVAEKSQAIQTETLRLSMSGEADKAVALLSAREAALECELATPLPRCDELIFQLLSARGPSLRYAILRPCWRRWRLRASYGLSWMRQRGVHVTLGCQHLPCFEARQLLARVIRTWHYGCGGVHRRLPIWCQERGSATARGFQMVADMSLQRQRLWLLRCSFGAWVCLGCFLPKRRLLGAGTARQAADLDLVCHLRWTASQRPPRRRAEQGLGKEDWSKLENLQVLRHLECLHALTARAVLRAWRLQVAKEMAFNAMLMLPDDQDLQALEFLDSVSAFSGASPSQQWDRQHVEGVDQPRLELPALSGPLAQPLLPVPRAQRAQQPGNSHNERSSWVQSRLWSPVSEDVDDMEFGPDVCDCSLFKQALLERWSTDDLAAELLDKFSKCQTRRSSSATPYRHDLDFESHTPVGVGCVRYGYLLITPSAVDSWLKTYDGMPPAVDLEDERHPANDTLYETVPKDALPGAESVRMTAGSSAGPFTSLSKGLNSGLVAAPPLSRAQVDRVLPFWHDQIAPCATPASSG